MTSVFSASASYKFEFHGRRKRDSQETNLSCAVPPINNHLICAPAMCRLLGAESGTISIRSVVGCCYVCAQQGSLDGNVEPSSENHSLEYVCWRHIMSNSVRKVYFILLVLSVMRHGLCQVVFTQNIDGQLQTDASDAFSSGKLTNTAGNGGFIVRDPSLQEKPKNVLRAQASIGLNDCLCQCSSITFKDSRNRVHGNCKSVDRTGARWCYTASLIVRGKFYQPRCQDKKNSQRYPGNTYSYHACNTPSIFSNQCLRLLSSQIEQPLLGVRSNLGVQQSEISLVEPQFQNDFTANIEA